MRQVWPGWDEPKPLNMNQTLRWVYFSLVHPSLRFQTFLPPAPPFLLFSFSTFFFSCSFALSLFFFSSIVFFSFIVVVVFSSSSIICLFSFFNFLFDFLLLFCCCYRFFFSSVFFKYFVTLVFFNPFFLSSRFFYCYNLFFIISFSYHFPSPYHIITHVAIACCTIAQLWTSHQVCFSFFPCFIYLFVK